MIPSIKHPFFGKQCPNPHNDANAAKMKRRGAKWTHISKEPIWKYDEVGREAFSHFAGNGTYYRPDPKPLNKKERRKLAKQNTQ